MPAKQGGRPRRAEVDTAILDATCELLISGGYERMTIEGIAVRANVGKPTIYRRWPSKAAIVAEAVLSGRLTLRPGTLDDTGDLVADLHRWLDEQFRWLEDPAAVTLIRGLAAAATDGGEASERLYERITSPGRHLLQRRLETAAQRGQIRGDVDTGAVVDAITGTLLYQALIPASARLNSGADGLLDLVLNGMRPQKDEALPRAHPVAPSLRSAR